MMKVVVTMTMVLVNGDNNDNCWGDDVDDGQDNDDDYVYDEDSLYNHVIIAK